MTCPHCSAENLPDASFCESCGKALPSTGASGPMVVTDTSRPKSRLATEHVAEDLKKQTRRAAGALLAVSILQAIGATFIIFLIKSQGLELIPVMYLVLYGVAAAFFGLFLWARKNPFPAAIAGLVLFITIHAIDAAIEPSNIASGWLIKIIIIVILINAIRAGQKYNQIAKYLMKT